MSHNGSQVNPAIRRRGWILFALGLILAANPGATLGAGGGIGMTINQIDDSALPDITAYVSVSDEAGAPIDNIAETAFAAAEDSRPIADLTVKPVVNANRSIALVLAIDATHAVSALDRFAEHIVSVFCRPGISAGRCNA